MRVAPLASLLVLAVASCSRSKASPSPPAPADEAPHLETIARTDEPDADDATWAYDTYLVRGGTKQLLASGRAAASRLWDWEGNRPGDPVRAGTSLVQAKIVGNMIRYSFDGSHCESNWMGNSSAEFTLAPLAVVSESLESSVRMTKCTAVGERWNWKEFSGRVSRECFQGERCEERVSMPIPDVVLPAEYVEEPAAGWQCRRLDGCSTVLDGAGHGFVTVGRPLASDPTLRVVLSGPWLFVQVDGVLDDAREDDRHWVSQEHIEISTGSFPSPGEACKEAKASQWGVRLADARVFPGAGASGTPPRAERSVCGPMTIVLRVRLPAMPDAVTVAYSAAAEGKQRLLVATSPIVYGDASTIGSVKHIKPERASCVVKGNALAPVMAPVESGSPLATFE